MSGDVAIIGAVVIGFALISRRVGPSLISSPMIFVAAGLITGDRVLDIVDLGLELEAIDVIGEATLGVLLFADASQSAFVPSDVTTCCRSACSASACR